MSQVLPSGPLTMIRGSSTICRSSVFLSAIAFALNLHCVCSSVFLVRATFSLCPKYCPLAFALILSTVCVPLSYCLLCFLLSCVLSTCTLCCMFLCIIIVIPAVYNIHNNNNGHMYNLVCTGWLFLHCASSNQPPRCSWLTVSPLCVFHCIIAWSSSVLVSPLCLFKSASQMQLVAVLWLPPAAARSQRPPCGSLQHWLHKSSIQIGRKELFKLGW